MIKWLFNERLSGWLLWRLVFSMQLESVEKTRLSLEQQTEEVRCAVEEKLKTAAAQRDENIKRMLDRLKEHVSII